jgi:membrane fusion protein (multidrug efflux system)
VEARLVSTKARRDQAVADLIRVQGLTEKEITSAQQLDAAKAAADGANADVAALEADLAAARAAEEAADAAGRAAEARLARAEVDVERAKLELSYARVLAPGPGVASQLQVEVGQLIQASQPLGAVVDDTSIWITANLKETETSEVREGQSVTIEVDAYPGCEARGTVESMSPATGSMFALLPPDNATGNFTKVVQRVPVRIAVQEGCGDDRPLRPGMSVVVHIAVR